jgi:hypothetical protein
MRLQPKLAKTCALAQRNFGSASFYFLSVAGGLLSSAFSIALAATLIAHGELTVITSEWDYSFRHHQHSLEHSPDSWADSRHRT